MNKQEKEELITFVNRAKEDLNFSFSAYHKTCPGYVQGNKLINYIEHLYEQQKVKVKQFVADWFEEHKHDLSNSLWEFTAELNEKTLVTGAIYTEFESWFIEHPRAYEVITSMKNGYEVEEEQKYYIKEPVTGQFLVRDETKSRGVKWVDGFSTHPSYYTETEIEAIEPIYLQFKVPVEKV